MRIILERSKLRPLLFGALGLVTAAGVAVELARVAGMLSRRSVLLRLLSLSHEQNLPTLYTAFLLLCCALLAALSGAAARARGGGFVAHWWVLAIGFAYIAVDEILMIHEGAGALVFLVTGPSFRPRGALHYVWVVPAALVVLSVGLAFVPFLRRLPPRIRNGFLIAGGIYVGGAVGMELPLGYWVEVAGTNSLGYALIDALEESMEMLGLSLFVLTAASHLANAGVTLGFASAENDMTAAEGAS